jgi:hypothetical protein
MRLENVFLSVRPIVESLARPTCPVHDLVLASIANTGDESES